MKATFKIPTQLLATMRSDLRRPHAFAHERVGFLTAGAMRRDNGALVLFAREYRPVADEDYLRDPSVGALIGSAAMRKGLQLAYRPRATLLHVHTHGGRGAPAFSGVDLTSGAEFVPGFFNAISRMPHGLLVLSDDSATALLWMSPHDTAYVTEFVGIGGPCTRFGGHP